MVPSEKRCVLNKIFSKRNAHASLHQGRIQAARHLLARLPGSTSELATWIPNSFDAKLEAIGDWVCEEFGVKRAWDE